MRTASKTYQPINIDKWIFYWEYTSSIMYITLKCKFVYFSKRSSRADLFWKSKNRFHKEATEKILQRSLLKRFNTERESPQFNVADQ